jgi:hypothetical protein
MSPYTFMIFLAGSVTGMLTAFLIMFWPERRPKQRYGMRYNAEKDRIEVEGRPPDAGF